MVGTINFIIAIMLNVFAKNINRKENDNAERNEK